MQQLDINRALYRRADRLDDLELNFDSMPSYLNQRKSVPLKAVLVYLATSLDSWPNNPAHAA